MRFTLTYRGLLLGSRGDVAHKHEVRRKLHPQLRELWTHEPLSHNRGTWLEPGHRPENREAETALCEVAGHAFAVLVRARLKLVAELDILLLRPEPAGGILQRADIDNRLRILCGHRLRRRPTTVDNDHMPTNPEIAVKFHRKDAPIGLADPVPQMAKGFVLRDSRDHEHHFGTPERLPDMTVFTYVSSYSPDGGPKHEYHLRDILRQGREVVTPSLGPHLSPLARAAVDHVIDECARKGFAFELEKEIAVHALLALQEVGELPAPADVDVYGATHGFERADALEFSELARKVAEGRSFRPAIKLPPGHGDKLRTYWHQHPSRD